MRENGCIYFLYDISSQFSVFNPDIMVIIMRSALFITLFAIFRVVMIVSACLTGQDIVAWISKHMNMDNNGNCKNISF